MKVLGYLALIEKIETFYYKVYGTEECRVCRQKIRCSTSQFIKKKNKIQCTQCKRYLEAVKEK